MDKQFDINSILNAKEFYLYYENTLYVVDKDDEVYGYNEKTDEWYHKSNFWDYFDSPIMLTYLKKISKEEAVELYKNQKDENRK